ncbi:MAG: hypothetical protein NTV40_02215 [Solirubrobacterales bacterium]|nr:hypothetical protein [Solirubrobacterales bacterium]
MARVVALVPDLLFGSRLLALLESAGYEVALCSAEEQARAAAVGADLLIADLSIDPEVGVVLVQAMNANGECDELATVAVYSHVDAQTRARAQAAGFDLVVPRSRMVREGADLVAGLLGGKG